MDGIVEREGRDITVMDIMHFVTAKARASVHPIFGKVVSDFKSKPSMDRPRQLSNNARVHSYAI